VADDAGQRQGGRAAKLRVRIVGGYLVGHSANRLRTGSADHAGTDCG
jgi:hypothetical protein